MTIIEISMNRYQWSNYRSSFVSTEKCIEMPNHLTITPKLIHEQIGLNFA